jgi:hypothetical protein
MQHPTNDTITTDLPDPGRQGFHNFFLPCQLRFINDPSRNRIVEKPRQIGIALTALTTSFGTVHWPLTHPMLGFPPLKTVKPCQLGQHEGSMLAFCAL